MTEDTDLERFTRLVEENLRKQGFPASKVAFPLDRMYESAHKKGVNFNQVLSLLGARGVAHEKTPEKVIFMPAPQEVPAAAQTPLGGLDMSMLQHMSPEQMMAMVGQALQQMSPEQLQALQGMMENMSEEERAQMLAQAEQLGLFGK